MLQMKSFHYSRHLYKLNIVETNEIFELGYFPCLGIPNIYYQRFPKFLVISYVNVKYMYTSKYKLRGKIHSLMNKINMPIVIQVII